MIDKKEIAYGVNNNLYEFNLILHENRNLSGYDIFWRLCDHKTSVDVKDLMRSLVVTILLFGVLILVIIILKLMASHAPINPTKNSKTNKTSSINNCNKNNYKLAPSSTITIKSTATIKSITTVASPTATSKLTVTFTVVKNNTDDSDDND
ncbi:hypothetical protein Glove_71g29 [Diversispora epigaea]|uniref:Uncharacterized protein n=1 Tax=Diversispora epigaea TaxID=1348612 RepID=A0A397JKQ0_9GLOM|nr:hypothetical protein Glove_71g29 [Diversispora epigaea]